jgi:hypothetical protein
MAPQKFSEEDINAIKSLQSKYQEKLIYFGQLTLERLSIEQSIKSLNESENTAKIEYLALQKEEEALIDSLSSKYGDGTLNLKDGTFSPSQIIP